MRKPAPGTVIFLVALLVALGGTGLAATGGNFILGQSNTANKTTALSGQVGGEALQVSNTTTTSGAGAVGLTVAAGHPPITVNGNAGKATNLNADKVDGFDASSTPGAGKLLALGSNGKFPSSAIPGNVTAVFQNREGPLPISGTFSSSGGNLVVTASGAGTAYSGAVGMVVLIDGTAVGEARVETDGTGSHQAFVPTSVPIHGIPSGTHTPTLKIGWSA